MDVLQKDDSQKDLWDLINLDTPLDKPDQFTFLMPAGQNAVQKLLDLKEDHLSSIKSKFSASTLGEVCYIYLSCCL